MLILCCETTQNLYVITKEEKNVWTNLEVPIFVTRGSKKQCIVNLS